MTNTYMPPPMILFINGDITYPSSTLPVFPGTDPKASELTTLQTQLFINDTVTKAEFDARVAADINYPTIIHLQNLRVMVILPTFHDLVNRQYADVVIFLHQGLGDIECNRFGPPGQNYEIQRINIYAILRAVHSPNVAILPFGIGGIGGNCCNCCEICSFPFYCDRCHDFSGQRICRKCNCSGHCGCTTGLIDNQGVKQSSIHAPNCDNEAHNHNFIHRK
jgi:hypothetical protein